MAERKPTYEELESRLAEAEAQIEALPSEQETQQNLHALFDTLDEFLFVLDREGRILHASPAAEKRLGYSLRELRGMPAIDFRPSDQRDEAAAILNDIMAGTASVCDVPLVAKDGTLIDVETRGTRGKWDGQDVLFGVARDVSERKRAEWALQESEQKFRAIFDQTYQFIGLMTLDGTLIEANRSALDFAGIEESDVLGKPFWETAWWTHSVELQNRLRDAVRQAATGEFVRFEAYHPARDGSVHYIDISLKPVKDEAGNVRLLIPEGRDVTDRKRAEGELREAHDELERRVEERTANLAKANDQLRREIEERRQAEEALHETEQRYREIVDNVQDAIFTIALDGTILFLNPAWEAITGLPRAEWMGRPFAPLVHPDDLPLTMERFESALKGESPPPYEVRFKTGFDAYKTGHFVIAPRFKDGEVIAVVGIGHDITERKRTQLALEQSERRYRRLVEGSPAVLYVFSTKRGGIFCSSRVADVLGYSPAHLLENPFLWSESIHPDDLPQVQKAINDAKSNVGFDVEYRVKSSHGKWIWLHDCSLGTRRDGDDVLIEGIATDITKRKEAEQALAESEERYRLLAENATDVIWISGLDHRCTYISPSVESLRGYTAEEAMRQTLDEVFTPASAALARKTLAETLSAAEEEPEILARPVTLELEENCKDGSTVQTEVIASFLLGDDGSPVALIGVTRDITLRKEAEKALAKSERKFRGLAERSFDLVFMTDRQGTITYVSPAVRRVLSAGPEEVRGRHFTEFLAESEIPRVNQLFAETLMGKDAGIVEMEVTAKDGGRTFVELNATLVLEGDEAVGTQGVIRDVTDRKLAQKQLKEREKELVHLGRLSTMGEMAAGIAHELKQPLYAITNYATGITLRLQDVAADSRELTVVMEKISGQARRASDIIDRLRSTVQKCEPCRSPTDMNDLLKDLFKLVEHEIHQESVDLHLHLQDKLPPVLADVIQIQQVALNLIRNALDAMRGIPSKERQLTLTTSAADGDMVEVCVADTGAGLSEEVHRKIFDAFFSTKTEGLGMGLAICRTIVEAHEGRLWATPNSPHGTLFRFVIPTEAKKGHS